MTEQVAANPKYIIFNDLFAPIDRIKDITKAERITFFVRDSSNLIVSPHNIRWSNQELKYVALAMDKFPEAILKDMKLNNNHMTIIYIRALGFTINRHDDLDKRIVRPLLLNYENNIIAQDKFDEALMVLKRGRQVSNWKSICGNYIRIEYLDWIWEQHTKKCDAIISLLGKHSIIKDISNIILEYAHP